MDYRQSKQQADADRKAEQAFDDCHRFLVKSGEGGTNKPDHHDHSRKDNSSVEQVKIFREDNAGIIHKDEGDQKLCKPKADCHHGCSKRF